MRAVGVDGVKRLVVALAGPPLAAGLVLAYVFLGSNASSAPVVYPPDVAWADATLPDAKPIYDARPADALFVDVVPDGKTKDAKADALDVSLDVPAPIPPDPTPLTCESLFVLGVQWDKGAISIQRARREKLPKKTALPHHFGRFAIELYVGDNLLERDRFDFPLVGDDGPMGESIAKGVVTLVDVKVPESDRPTRMEIWDRATDKRWTFGYPPKLTP